jgi:hypothetical protein
MTSPPKTGHSTISLKADPGNVEEGWEADALTKPLSL